MKFIFSSVLLIVLLASCGSMKKLKVENVKHLYLEYNHAADLNFGTQFEGKVMAVLRNGKEVDVTNHRKLTFASEDVEQLGNSKRFKVIKHPKTFTDNFAVLSLVVTDNDETFGVRDTVRINFRGDLNILAGGQDGANGDDKRNKGSRILLRDGKIGEDGENGRDGSSSNNFVANIWKEENMVFIYIRSNASNQEWKYKTADNGALLFDLSGGDGGDGGKGGDGGEGKDGTTKNGKPVSPGNGGNGGNGSDGGNGGNGGSIEIILHPNATDIEPLFVFRLMGGERGKAGKPGEGGKPGEPLEGQLGGFNGRTGMQGFPGNQGVSGVSSLSVVEFDIEEVR